MVNLRGFTEEYWRNLYFDKKLTHKEMGLHFNCSEALVRDTIKQLGWSRNKPSKSTVNDSFSQEDIKKLADAFNLDERIIEADLTGINNDMRNIDVIIHKERKFAPIKIASYYNQCICETCCVDWDYCRNKFRDEYRCERIIDAWMEEPAEWLTCLNDETVKNTVFIEV